MKYCTSEIFTQQKMIPSKNIEKDRLCPIIPEGDIDLYKVMIHDQTSFSI